MGRTVRDFRDGRDLKDFRDFREMQDGKDFRDIKEFKELFYLIKKWVGIYITNAASSRRGALSTL